MAQNSATITVLEALKEHQHRLGAREREAQTGTSGIRPGNTHLLVDLSVVIVSVSVNHNLKKAEVLVGDHSLKKHQCARILFWGLSSAELEKFKSFQKGDIARVNCVTIRKDYSDCAPEAVEKVKEDGNLDDIEPSAKKMSTILCDFAHSFQSPATGSSFGKIASWNPMVSYGYVMSTQETGLCPSLITARKIIHAVGQWFLEHHQIRISYNRDDCRYQKRKIRDLVMPNMLSEVKVQASAPSVDHVSSLSNRKRYSPAATTTFRVILTDGDGVDNEKDSIPLHIESNQPLLGQLRKLSQTNGIFILRHILTVRNDASHRPYDDDHGGNVEIILIPTKNTSISTVSLSPPVRDGYAHNLEINKKLRLTYSHSEDEESIQLSKSESPSSFFLGEHRSVDVTESTRIPNAQRMSSTIFNLSQIQVQGSSFDLSADSSWPDASTLATILTTSDGCNEKARYRYRPSILTIRGPTNENKQSSTHLTSRESGEIRVKADEFIMQTLCGSYDARQLVVDGVTIEKVWNFLKGVISLKVPLEWTLVQKMDGDLSRVFHVEDVSLPSLDI